MASKVQSGQLCECGCGAETLVAPQTRTDRGWVRGEPLRFLHGHGRRGRTFSTRVRQPARPVVSDRLCGCGCGEWTLRWPGHPANRFVRGHNQCVQRKSKVPRVPTPLLRRRVKVRWVADERGCWIWQLRVDHWGYGRARVDGRDVGAHRLMYEHLVGPVPAGHDLHHDCENKRCVNPAHLRPLTPVEHGRLHEEDRLAA